MTAFKDYGLSDSILKALELLKYQSPTKVQKEVLPVILEGKDLIVKSQTGSGKTAAFAIPICEAVNWEENKPQALVLTPTRELAMQVKEDFFHIGRFKRLKVVALYGKASFTSQQKDLKQKTHVVVGTPGRVLDHLERGTFLVDQIDYLVIDEADEMFRMGFLEQVGRIIEALPQKRVTLLFSATMQPQIAALCEAYMTQPLTVEIAKQGSTVSRIEEAAYEVKEEEKAGLLHDLMVTENPESCMVFCNTKGQVDQVYSQLTEAGYEVNKIHSDLEQKDRFKVMDSFRKGEFRYLVATDVAARGIDIDHITHVVNYDLPEDKESYVHRIGRTGRAGRSGKAMTFITPRDSRFLKAVQDYIGHELPVVEKPNTAEVIEKEKAFNQKMKEKLAVKETKGALLGEGILKLHINAGKKTKMRPVDIVGTLCNLPGMTAQDIGIINVLDVSTFVEILNHKGEAVYKALQNTPIKGRLRKVSKAELERG